MTTTRIDAQDLRAIFRCIADRIEREEPALNALDAAIGDGDHGITMRLGFQAVQKALAAMPPETPISGILKTAGRAFMGATGGAIGIIMGRMLMAAGNGAGGAETLGPTEFKKLLDAMEAGVIQAGKAQPGDKTLLDSLHAACASLASLPPDESLAELCSRAAAGAEAGARSTAQMVCRTGRASRLGERVLGHPDPGAVSFSLMMRSMAEWVKAGNAVPAREA